MDWQAYVPTDTADHLATMARAARDSGCGVPWQLLAAIARVESDFGRNMATSSAGAIGYGQFLPSSWQAFGNDGNVYDYRAALPAIATYLCQSGLERDPRSALFAYNHADWYVDLVLDLAVRYDRLAPGAPTPDVLDLSPAVDASIPMHYAPGRDVGLQARARSLDGQATWLGVPWRGRRPGSSIAAQSLETTTVAMLRAAFGLTGDAPQPSQSTQVIARAAEASQPGGVSQADLLSGLADRAWAGGLFANPMPFADQWSVAEIRERIERGQTVVAVLNPRLLPGHPSTEAEASGDQPVLVIGLTAGGLVISDPSFSSSLGYGLEISEADLDNAWQAAATPIQALAISTRPEPPLRDDYFREAQPGQNPVAPRVNSETSVPPQGATEPTVTTAATAPPSITVDAAVVPPPSTTLDATAAPPPNTTAATAPPSIAVDAAVVPPPSTTVSAAAAQAPGIGHAEQDADRSWLILAGAALFVGAAFGLRRLRARRLP